MKPGQAEAAVALLCQVDADYWGIFSCPVHTLQTALLAGIEHNGKMWTLLFAQPVRKVDILWAKVAIAFIVIGISQTLMLPLTLAGGLLLRRLNPALGFEPIIPLAQIALLDGVVYILSFIAIALQVWVSLKWMLVTAVRLIIARFGDHRDQFFYCHIIIPGRCPA